MKPKLRNCFRSTYLALAVLNFTASFLLFCLIRSDWCDLHLRFCLAGCPQWKVSFTRDEPWIPEELKIMGVYAVVLDGHTVVAIVNTNDDIVPYPPGRDPLLKAKLKRHFWVLYNVYGRWYWFPVAGGFFGLAWWMQRMKGDTSHEGMHRTEQQFPEK